MTARTGGAVLAIDPAYAAKGPGCACALFCGGRLSALYYARPARQRPATPDGAVVVWERPQARPLSNAPKSAHVISLAHANVLIQLACAGATLAGACAAEADGTVVEVPPLDWKGSTSKPVHHKRVLEGYVDIYGDKHGGLDQAACAVVRAACGDDVRERVDAACRAGGLDRWAKPGASYYGAWTGHNLLDAVGLGLWYLERNR